MQMKLKQADINNNWCKVGKYMMVTKLVQCRQVHGLQLEQANEMKLEQLSQLVNEILLVKSRLHKLK